MSFRWFEENEPFIQLAKKRQDFYDKYSHTIETYAPGSIQQIRDYWNTQLREIIDGQRDGLKVDDLGPIWDYPHQNIYDALEDWDLSRWFAGLLLMKTVMEHPGRFCAYRSDDEGSTFYFKDNRFYTNLKKMKGKLGN